MKYIAIIILTVSLMACATPQHCFKKTCGDQAVELARCFENQGYDVKIAYGPSKGLLCGLFDCPYHAQAYAMIDGEKHWIKEYHGYRFADPNAQQAFHPNCCMSITEFEAYSGKFRNRFYTLHESDGHEFDGLKELHKGM